MLHRMYHHIITSNVFLLAHRFMPGNDWYSSEFQFLLLGYPYDSPWVTLCARCNLTASLILRNIKWHVLSLALMCNLIPIGSRCNLMNCRSPTIDYTPKKSGELRAKRLNHMSRSNVNAAGLWKYTPFQPWDVNMILQMKSFQLQAAPFVSKPTHS